MHVPTNVKSPNNISKWQMGFNSAFKGLINAASIKTAELNSLTGHLTPAGTPRVVLLRFGLNAISLLLTDRAVESGFGPPSKGGQA
jgi:hypothetical protein